MSEKSVKPARKRATTAQVKVKHAPRVEHAEIAQRAYYIHLDEGCSNELDNWLRAERELTAV